MKSNETRTLGQNSWRVEEEEGEEEEEADDDDDDEEEDEEGEEEGGEEEGGEEEEEDEERERKERRKSWNWSGGVSREESKKMSSSLDNGKLTLFTAIAKRER